MLGLQSPHHTVQQDLASPVLLHCHRNTLCGARLWLSLLQLRQDVLRRWSRELVGVEQSGQQLQEPLVPGSATRCVQAVRREDSVSDLLEDARLIQLGPRAPLVQERQGASREDLKERDSHGPHVPCWPLIHCRHIVAAEILNHGAVVLGRHVTRVSESQPLVLGHEASAAVVRDGHARGTALLVLGVDEEVLGLQVIVHTAAGMEEGNSRHGLLEEAGDDGFVGSELLHIAREVTMLGKLADGDGLGYG
mmetsp:Transcript_55802/g.129968  ORF Transcript_55802/g.129968 Transcript_55802/m.129968 type:complete len:250 (-) Transcript_55802:64-813(-)